MKKHTIIIFSILTAFHFVGCDTQQPTDEVSFPENQLLISKAQWKENNMELTTPTNKLFKETIQTNGVIDLPPDNKAVVSVKTPGFVKNIKLLEGDFVKKGQVLFNLENPELIPIQQEFLEIHEQLNYLQNEYERQQKMYDEKITAQKNYLKAESEYKTAKAKYTGLKKQLNVLNIPISTLLKGQLTTQTSVRAPISGYVSNINVVKGSYLSSATNVLEIANHDHLHLELYVFEKDILKLEKDQPITFTIPEVSNQKYKAHVHLIGKTILENRRIQVHAHLTDSEKNDFLIGMFAQAEIVLSSRNKLALPISTLVETNNSFYALRLIEKNEDGYLFEKIILNTGQQNEHAIEITSTLDSTASFLKSGAFNLLGE